MLVNSFARLSQPTPAPQTRLDHLPADILLEIINHVAHFAPRESKKFKEEKSKLLVWQQDLGATKSVWTYNQPESPILNSLQALSAVNERLNHLCRPILWRTLHFPSSLPITMSHWDELMLKYGDHVQSLTIWLSKDWLAEPWKRPHAVRPRRPVKERSDLTTIPLHERDNLVTREKKAKRLSDDHQPLSRDNVFRLIAQCPNLISLQIILKVQESRGAYLMKKTISQISARRLQINLASLAARLRGIRHLKASGCLTEIPARCIIHMVEQLPCLESLSSSSISSDSPEDVIDFANALSGLKNLNRLSFHSADTLDTSMGFCPPEAAKITNLQIKICKKLLISTAPSLINTWTPNLTHLTLYLSCHFPPPEYMEDMKAFDPSKNQFSLPELTNLTLWDDAKCSYLQCFQESQKIRHLTYIHIKKEACTVFHEVIVSHYPQLNTLRLNVLTKAHDDDYQGYLLVAEREGFLQALAPLDRFCQEKGIHFEP